MGQEEDTNPDRLFPRAESEDYEKVFNTIGQGFCVVRVLFDDNGKPVDLRFSKANPAFARQAGLISPRGKRIRKLSPEQKEQWLQACANTALTGEPARFQCHLNWSNRWYDFSAFRIGDAKEQQVAVLLNDITEFKRAEEAVRESERQQRELAMSSEVERARLATVLEQLPVGVWIADRDGKIVGKNEAADRIWVGNAPLLDRIDNYPEYTAWCPGTGKMLSADEYPVAKALRTNQPVERVELNIRRFDGTEGTVLVWAAPIQDRDGLLTGAIGINVDITERKRAEEALRQSEERFRFVANNVPDTLFFQDRELRYVWIFNPADPFVENQVVGKTDADLIAPEEAARLTEIKRRVLETGVGVRTELQLSPGGITRWYEARYEPSQDSEGRIIGLVSHVRDISGRKRAEEELREINRTLEERVAERTAEAERRAEELQALAAELARIEQREQRRLAEWLHDDLQQLLVAAKMQISLTQSAIKEQDLRELLGKSCQLIDESIAESRSMTAELTPPVLYQSGLVPGLEQLARWIGEKHHLNVTIETNTNAKPENQEAAAVLFGATRELLFNVVKHAGVSEASVTLWAKNGRLQVSVEDHGAGFEQELAAGGKAGFGLLNVRERLRSIGGEVQIRSAPGQGTSVTLIAPLSPAPPTTESSGTAGDPDLPPGSDLENKRRIRVLLVDDHQMVRQGLAGLLENETGFEVVGQAGDGHEAIELARRLSPDIITMDVTMPGLNGIEATRRIKNEFPHMRIIGLSMHGEKEQGGAMCEAGAEAYLNKGGPSEELLAAIRSIAGTERDG
jgi:PAS domain S-box-containing protein